MDNKPPTGTENRPWSDIENQTDVHNTAQNENKPQNAYEKLEPENHVEKKRRVCTPCHVVCCLCTTFILLAVVLAIVVLVLYLVFQPKKPEISVTVQSIQNFNVSSNLSTSLAQVFNALTNNSAVILSVMGRMVYELEVHNPNKFALTAKNTTAVVYYSSEEMAISTLSNFEVGANDNTTTTVDFVFDVPISSSLAVGFLSDYLNGTVPFVAKVKVDGTITILGITSPSVDVVAMCNVGLSVNTQTVAYQNCKIGGVSF